MHTTNEGPTMRHDPLLITAIRGNPEHDDYLSEHQAHLVLRRLNSRHLVIVDRDDDIAVVTAEAVSLALAYDVWQSNVARDDSGEPLDLAAYDEGRGTYALQALDLIGRLTTKPAEPQPVLRYTNLDEDVAHAAMGAALGLDPADLTGDAGAGVTDVITALNDGGVVLCAEVLGHG